MMGVGLPNQTADFDENGTNVKNKTADRFSSFQNSKKSVSQAVYSRGCIFFNDVIVFGHGCHSFARKGRIEEAYI